VKSLIRKSFEREITGKHAFSGKSLVR